MEFRGALHAVISLVAHASFAALVVTVAAAQEQQTVRRPIGPSLVDHRPIEPRRDLVYATVGQLALRADIYRPLDGPGPFPAVLTMHGGSWTNGTKARMGAISTRLARAGYIAVAIDYRLAPTYRFPAQIEDCRAAIRWMRTYADRLDIDPNRIGAWGYSAGGHLVELLATTADAELFDQAAAPPNAANTRLQAVVAGGAPAEFRDLPIDGAGYEFFFGATRRQRPDLYELASPARFVSADDPPLFLYHGSDDNLVPIRNSRLMLALLERAGVPCELFVVDGAIHPQAALNADAARAAVAFLDRHLKPVREAVRTSD
ncbi:MAG: alpha/beta hydrolase [Pirellulales bacterium]|nr:alpha/beta hydrolase [Pirellulales bacterium]